MLRRNLLRALGALPLSFSALPPALAAAAGSGRITISAADASGQYGSVTVPANPKRLAVADFAVLDTLDRWGLGSRVAGLTKQQRLPYLSRYFERKNGIEDLGSLREIDLERLMSLEPDVIFASARLRRKFAELNRIAPVVCLPVDWAAGDLSSFVRITKTLGALFGAESKARSDIEAVQKRVHRISARARGRTALIGMVTSAHVNLLGDRSRCSLIGRDLGFKNLAGSANATHGVESSFELILKLNPEYFFVLDRDSAIGRQGAKLARDVLDNELIASTRAARQKKIIYLNAAAWYLSEGGVQSMNLTLDDVAGALGMKA